jgi:hypothetical protein
MTLHFDASHSSLDILDAGAFHRYAIDSQAGATFDAMLSRRRDILRIYTRFAANYLFEIRSSRLMANTCGFRRRLRLAAHAGDFSPECIAHQHYSSAGRYLLPP